MGFHSLVDRSILAVETNKHSIIFLCCIQYNILSRWNNNVSQFAVLHTRLLNPAALYVPPAVCVEKYDVRIRNARMLRKTYVLSSWSASYTLLTPAMKALEGHMKKIGSPGTFIPSDHSQNNLLHMSICRQSERITS